MNWIFSILIITGFGSAALANQPMNIQQPESIQLEVTNSDGQPIAGAAVMIGLAENDPFQGNVFTTTGAGTVEVPAVWKTPLPITVSADGYLTKTFSEAQPLERTLVLETAETEAAYEFKGEVKGFGRLRRDGKVDVGFVMPAFTKRELLGFDISSVMSPEMDTITILNRNVDIPSNISLPKQTETYIFPITLNKPAFRIYSRTEGPKKFVASHARFPLKRVVDKIRGGENILEVINDITFVGGGLKTVEMSSSSHQEDMNVDEFQYNDKISITGVDLPADKVMFSVAVKQDGEHFFPTDLKFVKSGQTVELATLPSQGNRYVASLLANKPEEKPAKQTEWDFLNPQFVSPLNIMDMLSGKSQQPVEDEGPNLSQMSITLQKHTADMGAPVFLPLVPEPVLSDREVILSPPELPSGIIPLGTVVVYSRVETIEQENFNSEKRTRLWEIFAPNWPDRVNIPDIEVPTASNISHRWEVIYLGKAEGSSNMEGINAVTHISRNSVNID